MKRLRSDDPAVADLVHRGSVPDAEIEEQVRRILADVRSGGDEALRSFTQMFDRCHLDDPWLDDAAWDRAAADCPEAVQAALKANADRIETFHARQVPSPDEVEVAPGITLGRIPVPYERVACYVPGGRASYPSTVLMTCIPARLAGVPQIIVVTPPQEDGRIDPAVAAAARAAGATQILRAGGAQAIGALAYGTETIPPVQAIVGPGNAFVTEAKRQVRDRVHLDAPAGPSELLILALTDAPPAWLAADLVAQAEHDPDARVVLVTPDADLADAVQEEVTRQATEARRRSTIEAALQHGAIIVAEDRDDAIALSNAYAPEHLELISDDPRADLQDIRDAGSVFLGPHAPVSLGDYGSGTNHVLPTMGQARLRGGLDVHDFHKWITWQDVTKQGLAGVADDITTVADAEGLYGHAEAVRRRT